MAVCDLFTKPGRQALQRDAGTSGLMSPASWLITALGGGDSGTGISVTEDGALRYTPFWAAVRVISSAVGSLPLVTYKRIDGGKERAPDHPVYSLLHDRPNEYVDAVTMMESRQAHALVYGNGYAEIQRQAGGRAVALWPMSPINTTRKLSIGGIPYYEIRMDNGETKQLPDMNVLHIKGLGFDGLTGYNVARYHREAIGLGMATKRYGAKFFGQGAAPGGVLERPKEAAALSQEAAARLRDSWESVHGGLDNAMRVAILEEGMTWRPTGISPEDAQALETQKFSVDDVARIFNIPPHMLASMASATYTNIEAQGIDFLTKTLYYWLRKWEQEVNYKLFMPKEQKAYFAEFMIDAFLRGDTSARSASYSQGRQWGWFSVNDIRRMENLNPIGEEGDIYLQPVNMVAAGARVPVAQPAPQESVRAAHRRLLVGLCKRIVHKEVNAIAKAAKHRGTFAGVADAFYAGHVDHIIEVLGPALSAYRASIGDPDPINGEIVTFANEIVLASRRSLEADMSTALALWSAPDYELSRAEVLANRLLNTENNNAVTNT